MDKRLNKTWAGTEQIMTFGPDDDFQVLLNLFMDEGWAMGGLAAAPNPVPGG